MAYTVTLPSFDLGDGDKKKKSDDSVGYSTVTKNSSPGTVDINSFLTDRPPPVIEPPEEAAEIRWGDSSNFEYDTSGSSVATTIVQDSDTDDQFWGKYSIDYQPSGDANGDGVDDDAELPANPSVLYEVQEVARQTEVVRVTGTGDAYVDIERIVNVIFEMPTRQGPTGLIKEFWRFNMNWGQ